ncbi:hypothetical protein ILYODFUR_020086 [Ilyodon furcidens]|uniref:Ephrin RBD domain-containing protein n=1 Tax=Ilyodon furcidens TaxID=33524 RepID=A0ABV0SYM5_9TELE
MKGGVCATKGMKVILKVGQSPYGLPPKKDQPAGRTTSRIPETAQTHPKTIIRLLSSDPTPCRDSRQLRRCKDLDFQANEGSQNGKTERGQFVRWTDKEKDVKVGRQWASVWSGGGSRPRKALFMWPPVILSKYRL